VLPVRYGLFRQRLLFLLIIGVKVAGDGSPFDVGLEVFLAPMANLLPGSPPLQRSEKRSSQISFPWPDKTPKPPVFGRFPRIHFKNGENRCFRCVPPARLFSVLKNAVSRRLPAGRHPAAPLFPQFFFQGFALLMNPPRPLGFLPRSLPRFSPSGRSPVPLRLFPAFCVP